MPLPTHLLLILAVSVNNVPAPIVTSALNEARELWRDAGVQIEWRTDDGIASRDLHVIIGDFRTSGPTHEIPIAWIDVIDGVPRNVIHVSRGAAADLLDGYVRMREMKDIPAANNMFLGRALGRALAHEIGHYLMKSRDHDRTGLMATGRSAVELFGSDRSPFDVTPLEQRRLLAALNQDKLGRGSNQ